MTLLRVIATAAGVAALLLEWAASCMAELDDALSDYQIEQRWPDFIPEGVDDGSATW